MRERRATASADAAVERRAEPHAHPPAEGHPRPLLRRAAWWALDGTWEFALDPAGTWRVPGDVAWDRTIEVPFAPETDASGVGHRGYVRACWYRRQLTAPPARRAGDRVVLHFGAVDHTATVWIDGHLVGHHEGGYSRFCFDVTDELADGREHELVVRAEDDPLDLSKPRGKQDWEPVPHSIWYQRNTGIWQTVWLERLSRLSVAAVQWSTDVQRLEVALDVRVDGRLEGGTTLDVLLTVGDRVLVADRIGMVTPRIVRSFRLDATGLDHLRESLFWTPDHPALVDAVLQLRAADGTLLDEVYSYTGLREIDVRAGRFVLNGRPIQMRLVLDQGYWERSGLTPPSDDAIRHDVELTKAMGFNGVRKHQKIEDPRYLYWADRLGLMVWAEMPPAYQFEGVAIRRVTDEWTRAIERDRSHPCIVAWVPFNESTGVLHLPARADERHWVRALTELTKALDPTRPVVSNDGWEVLGGDVIAIHDYEQDPGVLCARWTGDLSEVLVGYAPHGRLQTLDEDPASWADGRPSRPIVLTEFGGIGWRPDAPAAETAPIGERDDAEAPDDRLAQPAAWGYSSVSSAAELEARYVALLAAVHAADRLAGFCYTQLADTYHEVNGLLCADRTPKFAVESIARATLGPQKSFHDPLAPPPLE